MAIYHCSIRNISRSSGKSAVASSAYRSGSKMYDEEIGKTFNYSLKKEVAYSEIILCKNAPREYQDRQVLWNEVQKVEKASNSRLAREWIVAIPHELSFEESKELLFGFGKSLAEEGMCIQLDMHLKEGNYHGHFMGTTRPIKENGEWGQKEKKAFKLDENGQKIPIIDEKTGKQKVRVRKGKGEEKLWERVTVDANDWNKKEKIEEWRKRWAEHCNKYLQEHEKIDHRSYKKQGIKQLPTIHEGYVARQMELKGEVSEKCQYNREVKKYNELLNWIKENVYERIRRLFINTRELEQGTNGSRGREKAEREIQESSRRMAEINGHIDGYNSEIEERKQDAERRKRELEEHDLKSREEIVVPEPASAPTENSVKDIVDSVQQINSELRIALKQKVEAKKERELDEKLLDDEILELSPEDELDEDFYPFWRGKGR